MRRYNRAAFFAECDGNADLLLGADGVARFDYEHKGSLAYIGKDAAVADIPGRGLHSFPFPLNLSLLWPFPLN